MSIFGGCFDTDINFHILTSQGRTLHAVSFALHILGLFCFFFPRLSGWAGKIIAGTFSH